MRDSTWNRNDSTVKLVKVPEPVRTKLYSSLEITSDNRNQAERHSSGYVTAMDWANSGNMNKGSIVVTNPDEEEKRAKTRDLKKRPNKFF